MRWSHTGSHGVWSTVRTVIGSRSARLTRAGLVSTKIVSAGGTLLRRGARSAY
ncbi:MAG: hypothetical protein ACOZCF_12430 [Bacillota bacterium]